MLTLGTIDKLTEQSLLAPEGAGNEDSARSYVAGTGTIDASGKVGAIGGIKYKIIASGHHGAHYFFGTARKLWRSSRNPQNRPRCFQILSWGNTGR